MTPKGAIAHMNKGLTPDDISVTPVEIGKAHPDNGVRAAPEAVTPHHARIG
jgi:hypothetical protein